MAPGPEYDENPAHANQLHPEAPLFRLFARALHKPCGRHSRGALPPFTARTEAPHPPATNPSFNFEGIKKLLRGHLGSQTELTVLENGGELGGVSLRVLFLRTHFGRVDVLSRAGP